jgi:predicted acetyltransferase
VLHVVEIVAGSGDARRALLGHLARQMSGVGALAYPLACRSDLADAGLILPAARVRIAPSFMFRVVDVAAALRALDDLPTPAEWFSVSVLDPAGINVEPLTLAPSAHGVEVVEGEACEHQITAGIQAFSQLFVGYRRASDLHAQGRMRASSERAVHLADEFFKPREPFIGELDLF